MEIIIKLVSEVESMRKELKEKYKVIKIIEVRLAEVEQTSLEDTFKFAGLPEKEEKQTPERIKRVTAVAGVDLQGEDILDVKKIPDR